MNEEMKSLIQHNGDGQRLAGVLNAGGACRWLVGLFRMHIVAHIRALDPEDDVLGDVGGVVGNTLQISSDQQSIECLAHNVGALIHGLDQLDESVIAHAVDDVIHLKHRLRELDFAFNERFQSATNHSADGSTHAADVDRQVGGGKFDHIHDTLGDVDGLVAYAFEIGVDLGHRQNEAQVNRHGLLHGEQIERFFVDLALGDVDEVLAFEDHLAAGQV